MLRGWDFDITVGLSPTKILKAAYRGIRGGATLVDKLGNLNELLESSATAVGAAREIKKAAKLGDAAKAERLSELNKELIEGLVEDGTAEKILDRSLKGAASAIQAGGEGVDIPLLGIGLQAGLWKMGAVKAFVVTYNGCDNCDVGDLGPWPWR